jgi:hypothetical protein
MKIPKFVKDIGLEFLRYLVLGIIAHLISGGDLTITLIYTISLRITDKLLHKYGKEEDVDWLIKGITRF